MFCGETEECGADNDFSDSGKGPHWCPYCKFSGCEWCCGCNACHMSKRGGWSPPGRQLNHDGIKVREYRNG